MNYSKNGTFFQFILTFLCLTIDSVFDITLSLCLNFWQIILNLTQDKCQTKNGLEVNTKNRIKGFYTFYHLFCNKFLGIFVEVLKLEVNVCLEGLEITSSLNDFEIFSFLRNNSNKIFMKT